MPSAKPSFSSQIPEYLLANATPADRWLMENVSVLTQASTWHTDELCRQSDKLESIESQAIRTNGRVTNLEKGVTDIAPKISQLDQIQGALEVLTVGQKVIKTKTGKISMGVAFVSASLFCSYIYHNIAVVPALLGKFFSFLAIIVF